MVSQERWPPWIYWPFVAATAADYLRQVPRDLKFSDPILFTASVLGYLSILTGIAFLVYLPRHRVKLEHAQ